MWKGNVESINIAPTSGQPTKSVEKVHAIPGRGLTGDRHFSPEEKSTPVTQSRGREITLIEVEAIEALQHEKGVKIDPKDARRNIVTRGVPLNHLVGKEFQVGEIIIKGIGLCEPCGHLASLTQSEVQAALVHRGGLRCAIVTEGIIHPGDEISEL